MSKGPVAAARPVRVWDLPTRLFHWVLAVCVVGAIVSAKIGGNAMAWHFRFGLLALALLVFRLAWGFVGGHWSRFRSFLYAPSALRRYLRGEPRAGECFEAGHTPLGSLSVFALLGFLVVQAVTGLVADDEIGNTGPLYAYVGNRTAELAGGWHAGPGQALLIGLAVLHVAAIVFYRVRRGSDLVGPMIRGDKWLPPGVPPSRDGLGARMLALLLFAAAAALAVWIQSLEPPAF